MDSLQERKVQWTQRKNACRTTWEDAAEINFATQTSLEQELLALLVEEYAPEAVAVHRIYATQSPLPL